MVSRSLYINLGQNPLKDFFQALSIPLSNCWFYENPPDDHSFYHHRKNSASLAFVDGDFTHAIDVDFYDRNWRTLHGQLADISRLGFLIAVPDENSQSPFVYHLYIDGLRLYADIFSEGKVNIFKTYTTPGPNPIPIENLEIGNPLRLRAGPHWDKIDLYVDYGFEQMMFRWDCKAQKVFRKFYGEKSEHEIPQSNKLWWDAKQGGDGGGYEITKTTYERRKPEDIRFLNDL